MKSIVVKGKVLYILLFIVFLHAFFVLKPLLNIEFSPSRLAQDANMVIQQRQHVFSETEATQFSTLFGIAPVSFDLEPEEADTTELEPPPELLSAKQPRLLAIDEVSGVLTARILLSIDGKTEMKSLRHGDQLYGYKLEQITMHNVNFELVVAEQADKAPAQLQLKIFSRDK